MHMDQEVFVRSPAEFTCPVDSEHPFEYVVDRRDSEGYVWVFAVCEACPDDERFWLVIPGDVAAGMDLEDNIQEDLRWQEQVADLLVQGSSASGLDELKNHVVMHMVVELVKRIGLSEVRQILGVPGEEPLLTWASRLNGEDRAPLVILYITHVPHG